MKYFIKVDTNDADYVSEMTEITQKELEEIRPVIEAIKSFKPYQGKRMSSGNYWTHENNFPDGECCREDLGEKTTDQLYVETGLVTEKQLDAFRDFLPEIEFGIHTIASITLYHVEKKQSLL